MTTILALETSAAACSVALSINGVVTEQIVPTQRGQAQVLLPMIDSLLAEAQLSLADIDALALSIGPGSFTGLRVAMSVVQGLTISTDIPIIPIPSLQVLAQTAYRERGMQKVLVCVNAYMGELYWGEFALQQDSMIATIKEQLLKPENVALPSNLTGYSGIGSGWLLEPISVPETFIVDTAILPHAQDVAILAASEFSQGKVFAIDDISPVYLRQQDAWKTSS
ncbi:MAG: tRNA (adenosine(37)-N6)-threonylcarbamoyltransferase complex dimerization subunit type 1 TsaB [Gammaproteobacteria bacterium]|nr:tRNA (adenosine(37)-N6)-threonylcarbamoyltransferase complex dimerization subunit type 1 TsaB [Gammaproteobacteria bacterium]